MFLPYTHTQLEEVPFEDLNEDQRRKVERKEDVLQEISRLTKRVRKEDFMYVRKKEEILHLHFNNILKCVCGCPEARLNRFFLLCLLEFPALTHSALVLMRRGLCLPTPWIRLVDTLLSTYTAKWPSLCDAMMARLVGSATGLPASKKSSKDIALAPFPRPLPFSLLFSH